MVRGYFINKNGLYFENQYERQQKVLYLIWHHTPKSRDVRAVFLKRWDKIGLWSKNKKGKVGNVVFKHNTTLARNEKMFLPYSMARWSACIGNTILFNYWPRKRKFLPSLPGHSILKLPNLLKACCRPAERKHNINHHICFKLEIYQVI